MLPSTVSWVEHPDKQKHAPDSSFYHLHILQRTCTCTCTCNYSLIDTNSIHRHWTYPTTPKCLPLHMCHMWPLAHYMYIHTHTVLTSSPYYKNTVDSLWYMYIPMAAPLTSLVSTGPTTSTLPHTGPLVQLRGPCQLHSKATLVCIAGYK